MTNETIQTNTPSDPVSHSISGRHHGAGRTARRARIAVASAALLAGSFAVTTQVAANDEYEHHCTPTGQASADSLERQALACQAVLDQAYVECMRDTAGTPDSAERWVDYCQTRALG